MSTLSDVDAQWFSIKFNSMAARSGGTEYQALFVGIMEALHPGDFESVRPYGNKGDLKCDGLHRSTGTVFQVYAPRATKLAAMLSKIRADFEGARKHWAAEMKRWVFVYNDHEGLPADILKLLEKYRDDTGLVIETWGPDRLKKEMLRMPRMALVAHIGRPPQGSDFDKLAFPPIARVVEAIRGASVEKLAAIDPVSPDKLKANALTDAAVAFLNLGRKRERLVEQFFEKHPNPTLGEDVAAAFRQEYARLRFDGLSANHIFAELQSFTSGSTRRDPEHEAAVFAVLSYFFERCDIFEAQSTTEPS